MNKQTPRNQYARASVTVYAENWKQTHKQPCGKLKKAKETHANKHQIRCPKQCV